MTSTVIYEGELRTVARHLGSGTEINTDAPKDNQGLGERFSPTDLVATAVGSCILTIMGIKAKDMGIDLEGTSIDISKHMKTEPRRIGGIDATLHFPASLQLGQKERTILERAAKTCPVVESIHPDIELVIQFNWEPVPSL